MELHRKAYEKLLEWKNNTNGESAMLIEGARRVGKSYLVRCFAEKEYVSYIYIDFANVAKARQMIKYLVADGRYDYLETGSLISIKQNIEKIVIPSEEEAMQLNPLDFEEFLIAAGEGMLAEYIRECFKELKPMGNALHRKAMNLFRIYMVVGGMPQAVEKYCETKDLKEVNRVKQRIVKLYRDDIAKFAKGYESKVLAIFDEIPEQLTKHEKKFSLASINKNARFREYEDAFMWLSESKVVNHCFNSTEPSIGINLNRDRLTLKCYMADTGLLITHAIEDGTVIEEEVLKAIMFDRVGINEGMFLENMVAQMLVAAGHKLFFYSRVDKQDYHNNIEIDFLVRKGKKICPVEVKSGEYRKHTSLDRFSKKFSERTGMCYIVYTKDLKKEDDAIAIPVYMTMFL